MLGLNEALIHESKRIVAPGHGTLLNPRNSELNANGVDTHRGYPGRYYQYTDRQVAPNSIWYGSGNSSFPRSLSGTVNYLSNLEGSLNVPGRSRLFAKEFIPGTLIPQNRNLLGYDVLHPPLNMYVNRAANDVNDMFEDSQSLSRSSHDFLPGFGREVDQTRFDPNFMWESTGNQTTIPPLEYLSMIEKGNDPNDVPRYNNVEQGVQAENKNNMIKYLPWILGSMGLLGGGAYLLSRRNKRKEKKTEELAKKAACIRMQLNFNRK